MSIFSCNFVVVCIQRCTRCKLLMKAHLLKCVVQKSQTARTAAPKRSAVYEAPQIFRTDDYFQEQDSVMPTMNECNSSVTDGAVASSCNTDVSFNVPSSACFRSNLLEPSMETDTHEWTYNNCSKNAPVVHISSKDSSQKCAANTELLRQNDTNEFV